MITQDSGNIELQRADIYNELLWATGNAKIFTIQGFFWVGEDIGVKAALNKLAV